MGNDREERSRESCNPHSTALLVKDRKSEWLNAGVSKLCIVFCITVYLKKLRILCELCMKALKQSKEDDQEFVGSFYSMLTLLEP